MGEPRAAFTGWEGGVCLPAESLQSDPTLRNPVDCRPPGSSVHEILQARNTGLGCHALLQGIFPTPGMTVRRERMSNFLGNGRLHRNLEAGALMTGLCRLMPVLAAPSHWVAGSSEAAENEEWKCCSLRTTLGSAVHGILQARILEWVAISHAGGPFPPRDRTVSPASPALAGGFFTTAPPGKGASLVAQLVKNLPAMQETSVQFLGREDPLEKR